MYEGPYMNISLNRLVQLVAYRGPPILPPDFADPICRPETRFWSARGWGRWAWGWRPGSAGTSAHVLPQEEPCRRRRGRAASKQPRQRPGSQRRRSLPQRRRRPGPGQHSQRRASRPGSPQRCQQPEGSRQQIPPRNGSRRRPPRGCRRSLPRAEGQAGRHDPRPPRRSTQARSSGPVLRPVGRSFWTCSTSTGTTSPATTRWARTFGICPTFTFLSTGCGSR